MPKPKQTSQAYAEVRAMWRDTVERQWGQARPVDPDLCAQTLWAIIHGVVALDPTIADFPFSDRAPRVAEAIETAIRGIARGASSLRRRQIPYGMILPR